MFTAYIKANYGSKRGLLRLAVYRIRTLLKAMRSYTDIDFGDVKRLVFVCKGNICRSPLGAAVAKSMGVQATSFGLECGKGAPPDQRAVAYAKQLSIDLSNHVTTPANEFHFCEGDLVVLMEPKHASSGQFAALKGRKGVQVTLLGIWLHPPRPYIHDPYCCNDEYFVRCEKFVVESTKALVNKVIACN